MGFSRVSSLLGAMDIAMIDRVGTPYAENPVKICNSAMVCDNCLCGRQ